MIGKTVARYADRYGTLQVGAPGKCHEEQVNFVNRLTATNGEILPAAGLMRRTIELIGLEVFEHAVRSSDARAVLRPNSLERLVRDLAMYLRQPASLRKAR